MKLEFYEIHNYIEIPDELVDNDNKIGDTIYMYGKKYKICSVDVKKKCYVCQEFGGLKNEEATNSEEMSA